jgi:7-cyano-7-deazaguanine tRNA-ribosyltransferase
MYPFSQSVFPDLIDNETRDVSNKIYDEFLQTQSIVHWTDNELSINKTISDKNNNDIDLKRISSVADMQFGKYASKALFNGEINLVKSKKTGKIRNIYCNNQHILSMRAHDGLFTLKIGGAQLLHNYFNYPKLRVIVENDAIPFIIDGKSVFAKFVFDCDIELIPLDECLIVDKKDNLLSVGQCLLNRFEMLSFSYGIAAKTRESIKK